MSKDTKLSLQFTGSIMYPIGAWRISEEGTEIPIAFLPEPMKGHKDSKGRDPKVRQYAALMAAAPQIMGAAERLLDIIAAEPSHPRSVAEYQAIDELKAAVQLVRDEIKAWS